MTGLACYTRSQQCGQVKTVNAILPERTEGCIQGQSSSQCKVIQTNFMPTTCVRDVLKVKLAPGIIYGPIAER